MIKGTVLWNSAGSYHKQDNNSIESFVKARDGTGWLESCGPTALVNAAEALGVVARLKIDETLKLGTFFPQIEDVAFLYLNDPRNFEKFKKAAPDIVPGSIPGNRVFAYYPDAALDLFGIYAIFSPGLMEWRSLGKFLSTGRAIQLCLVKPGHYVTAVAFDEDTDEVIFWDPWKDRLPGGGFCARMSRTEYEGNVKPYSVVYSL